MLDDRLKDEISSEEFEFLTSLRPSRIREVQAGRRSWTTVQLLDIESGEGGILRDFLERFGIRVLKTEVGQARHLVDALQGDEPAPYVVLACHGDEGKIIVPELAEEYERFQPFHGGRIGPDEIRRFARVPGSVVIATGCDTGTAELAQAFFDAGATAYVAPDGAPFGYASLFGPVFLFYELTEGRTLDEAVDRLRAHDGELAMWKLFRPPASGR